MKSFKTFNLSKKTYFDEKNFILANFLESSSKVA